MSDRDEALKRTLDEAEWIDLKPHLERDAVILIDLSLDLLATAKLMAQDDRVAIEASVSRNLIRKPNEIEIKTWNSMKSKKFLCVIVQPFVLVQEFFLN